MECAEHLHHQHENENFDECWREILLDISCTHSQEDTNHYEREPNKPHKVIEREDGAAELSRHLDSQIALIELVVNEVGFLPPATFNQDWEGVVLGFIHSALLGAVSRDNQFVILKENVGIKQVRVYSQRLGFVGSSSNGESFGRH